MIALPFSPWKFLFFPLIGSPSLDEVNCLCWRNSMEGKWGKNEKIESRKVKEKCKREKMHGKGKKAHIWSLHRRQWSKKDWRLEACKQRKRMWERKRRKRMETNKILVSYNWRTLASLNPFFLPFFSLIYERERVELKKSWGPLVFPAPGMVMRFDDVD